MGWKSFFQGLAANIISAILILGVGAVLTILQATHSRWAEPSLYGMAGICLMAIIIFAFTGRPILSKKQPQTTVHNVESNIRAWIDYFGLGVQKLAEPESYFALLVTLRNGLGIFVARMKARDRYIVFGCNIEISPEHRNVLARLPKEKSSRIAEEVALELAKTGVGYNLEIQPDGTMTKISLQRASPITSSFSQDTFVAHIDQLESNVLVAREVVRLSVDSAKQQLPPAAH